MNIEEIAEKIDERINDTNPEFFKYMFATTIRECLAESAGVELKTTVDSRAFDRVYFNNAGDAYTSLCEALDDIDALLLALKARDAEIEKLKQELESARRNGEA